MGEDACYLPLVEIDGRLREGPVVPWPLDAEQDPPPGVRIAVRAGDTRSEPRLQLFENTAREQRLVLLYGPAEAEAAEELVALLLARLGAKKK